MVFTGYTKVEVPAPFGGGYVAIKIENSIDTTVIFNCYEDEQLITGRCCSMAGLLDGDDLWCHTEDDDDADNDYHLMSTDTPDDGAATEYSSNDEGVPIYEAITNDSPFSSNQDLSTHGVKWVVSHVSKASDIPSGETAYIRFSFYKVDTDDNETFLFYIEDTLDIFYPFSAETCSGLPAGSVTTDDRLLLRVTYYSAVPS